jgi:hypothetical protein
LRQLLAALRIVTKVFKGLGDAFSGNLAHLENGKLRDVTGSISSIIRWGWNAAKTSPPVGLVG